MEGRNEQVNFGQVHQESYSRPFGGELIIDELDPYLTVHPPQMVKNHIPDELDHNSPAHFPKKSRFGSNSLKILAS